MKEQLENIGCKNCPLLEKFVLDKRNSSYSDFPNSNFSSKRLKELYGQDKGFSNPYVELNRQNFSSNPINFFSTYKSNPMGYNMSVGLNRGPSYGNSPTSSGLSYESPKAFHGKYE